MHPGARERYNSLHVFFRIHSTPFHLPKWARTFYWPNKTTLKHSMPPFFSSYQLYKMVRSPILPKVLSKDLESYAQFQNYGKPCSLFIGVYVDRYLSKSHHSKSTLPFFHGPVTLISSQLSSEFPILSRNRGLSQSQRREYLFFFSALAIAMSPRQTV